MLGGTAEATTNRRGRAAGPWRRRATLGLVVAVVAVAVGFQVHVATVRDQTTRAEAAQRRAERDEQAAQSRLASVDARVRTAQADEADAQAQLDRARKDLAAKGLDEAELAAVQRRVARGVRELRAQARAVDAAVAEQQRLRPAAGTCVFDLLGAVDRAGLTHDTGAPTDACRAASGHAPVPR